MELLKEEEIQKYLEDTNIDIIVKEPFMDKFVCTFSNKKFNPLEDEYVSWTPFNGEVTYALLDEWEKQTKEFKQDVRNTSETLSAAIDPALVLILDGKY